MTDNEIKLITTAENLYRNGQMVQATVTLLNGLKHYPENNAMQDLLQQYQDIKTIKVPDEYQRKNKEITENKHQSKIGSIPFLFESNQTINNHTIQEDIDTMKQKNETGIFLMTKNLIQMRQKVLNMELTVVKTFYEKKLIENEKDISEKIHKLEICKGVNIVLDIHTFKEAENELLLAENLSSKLMRKINTVVKKNATENEMKNSERNVEVPNYRSILTVRGTEEDVVNCMLKATLAFNNRKYDRAESLLLKAERMFPTQNARDLLKQVRDAKELKQNSDRTEQPTKIVNIANTVKIEEKKEETTFEDNSLSAFKCLRAFEEAFNADNLAKAERLLNKAKRLDPSLHVEEKLSQVKAAKYNKIMEEKRKKEIEKAKRECEIAGEYLYKSMKAYKAGDLLNAEVILLQAMTFGPKLNLDFTLSIIRNEMASKGSEDSKDMDKTGPEETVGESDMKYAAKYLYKAKKAHDASDFTNALKYLKEAIMFDPSLDLNFIASTTLPSLTEGIPIISDDACSLSTERNKSYEIQKLDKENLKMGKKIFWFCFNSIVAISLFCIHFLNRHRE